MEEGRDGEGQQSRPGPKPLTLEGMSSGSQHRGG